MSQRRKKEIKLVRTEKNETEKINKVYLEISSKSAAFMVSAVWSLFITSVELPIPANFPTESSFQQQIDVR